jgi:hypothetical protein
MHFRHTLLTLSLASLLAACAPGHMYIEEGVVERIDHKLEAQSDQISSLSEQQELAVSQILSSYDALSESMIERLTNTIKTHVEPPKCAPQPRLVCPPQGGSGTLVLGGLEKQLVGEAERIYLANLDVVLPARIDTGATTSSIDARNINFFERDGKRWVRFDFVHPTTGDDATFERQVVRVVRISQSISDDYERRPVIELRFTLGNISQTAEFTLTDRSHLDFPVLIGRNILRDQMVVDVSKQHIAPLNINQTTP